MPESPSGEVNPYSPASLQELWCRIRKNNRTGQLRMLPTGADGCSTDVFERHLDKNIAEISRKILAPGPDGPSCRFGPLLEIIKIKSDGGQRRIYIPRIRDQLLLRAAHEDLLRAATHTGISLKLPPPGHLLRSVRAAFQTLCPAFVLRTDIKSFFESVPRREVLNLTASLPLHPLTPQILRNWESQLRARKPWTSGASHDFKPTGLPPGLSISASLAELWARQIDGPMAERYRYFRYADDIAVLCNTETEALEAREFLTNLTRSLSLSLSPGKTKIEKTSEGVNWLGLVHYPNHFEADPERVDRWFRRFVAIRRNALQQLKPAGNNPDLKSAVIKSFIHSIRDELRGKTSSRPAWYAGVADKGQWKDLDSRLHAIIRSVYRKAGIAVPENKNFPSVHRHMLARKSHL